MKLLRLNFGMGRIGRASISMAIGMFARGLILALYLVLTSRWLGASGYGQFAGLLATTLLFASLSGWGVSQVVLQRVSSNPETLPQYWKASLIQILLVGCALIAMASLLSLMIPNADQFRSVVLMIGAADLVALPMSLHAVGVLLAIGRSTAAAMALCLVPLGRLLAAISGLGLGIVGSVETLGVLHLLGSLAGTAAAIALVRVERPVKDRPAYPPPSEMLPAGTPYVAGSLVGSTYLEVDKVLILAVLGGAVLGPYTVAFRAASLFALPVTALMSAALPVLFASPSNQSRRRTQHAVVAAAALYGLAASIIVAMASPLLPRIFGSEYADASVLLLWLSPWPLLYALHQAVANGLTGAGRQGLRFTIEGSGLLLLFGASLLLLPVYGAIASILALLAVEALMTVACAMSLRSASGFALEAPRKNGS